MTLHSLRLPMLLGALTLASCAGQEPEGPALASIAITSEGNRSTIMLGETLELTAAGRDQNGNPFDVETFTWTSSNTSVATVNQNGLVTATGGGQTTITAASGSVSGTFSVTVQGSRHSTDITTSQTWRAVDNPHLVTTYISVEGSGGPILTIEPGVIIRFAAGAGIEVGYFNAGSIRANGTATSGISMVADAATPTKGHWSGLYIGSLAGPSELHYVTMSHCGGQSAGTQACIEIQGGNGGTPKLLVDNVTIQNSLTYGVLASGGGGFASASTRLSVSGGDREPIFIRPNQTGEIPTGGTFTNNTPNYIRLRDGRVETTQTWANHGIAYVLNQDVIVGGGSGSPTLTIAPGTEIRFDAGRGMSVGISTTQGAGNLVAVGTASAPIRFTANAATPTAGFWAGMYFGYAASSVSKLDHVIVEYGGGVDVYANLAANVMIEEDLGPIITNSTLRFSRDCGVVRRDDPWTTDFMAASLNNTFTSNARNQCGP